MQDASFNTIISLKYAKIILIVYKFDWIGNSSELFSWSS